MKILSSLARVGIVAAAGLAISAQAVSIVPASATASSSFAAYEMGFATDTGPNASVTDWSSLGDGANAFLDLDLGALYLLDTSYVTDRVTSGGPNGSFSGGVSDFTTQYSLTAFTDGTFTTAIGGPLVFNKSTPVGATSPTDFLDVQALGGLTAQYIRYSVTASTGPNTGLSDIHFDGALAAAVPEPQVWGLIVLGFGMVGVVARRRKQTVAA